tara:strand:- start:91968 stop:93122 length:1155 start_codon:yes stop_codon:yes gene_type:complete
MARRLYTLMPPSGEPKEFALASDKGFHLMSAAEAGVSSGDDVVVFVPGTEVGYFEVRIPAQGAAEIRRSATFALEDDVAVPVEEAHVAIGQVLDGGLRPVQVVDPALMEEWVARLNAMGLKTAKLVADVSVLPLAPTALDAGSHILMSTGEKRFAVDAALPDDALKALANASKTSPTITSAALAHRLGMSATSASSLPLLLQLAQWAETIGVLTDLRQGPFISRKHADIRIGAWRSTLILAAAAAAAFLAVVGLETWSLSRLSTVLDQHARGLYAAAYPGTPVPSNLDAALRSQEGAPAASRLSFLDATALLYEAIPAESGISIEGMRYDRQTGRLLANMVYPNYGSDADLKNALEAKGLGVSLGDSRQQDDRVIGDLTLEAAQ